MEPSPVQSAAVGCHPSHRALSVESLAVLLDHPAAPFNPNEMSAAPACRRLQLCDLCLHFLPDNKSYHHFTLANFPFSLMSLKTDSVSFGGITFSRINISDVYLEPRPSHSRWSCIRFSHVEKKSHACLFHVGLKTSRWIQEIKQKSTSEPLLPHLTSKSRFNKTVLFIFIFIFFLLFPACDVKEKNQRCFCDQSLCPDDVKQAQRPELETTALAVRSHTM